MVLVSALRTALSIATGRAPATRATTVTTVSLSGGGSAFGGSMAFDGGRLTLTDAERDYSAVAVAYRCVHMKASNLAAVDMVVLAGETVNEAHPVARLWNEGTPGAPYSARVVREVGFAQAELKGEAFLYVDRGEDRTGEPEGLHPLFDRVTPIVQRDDEQTGRRGNGTLLGFRVDAAGGAVFLLPSEVLWLRYPHPTQRWGALAPWRAARYAVEVDALARSWQRSSLQNNARPGSIVDLGDVDQQVHELALAEFRTKVEGPQNAGRSLLLSGPGTKSVHHLGFTPEEMNYLKSRVANADEIMVAFGVHPDLLRGGSTYENRAAAKTALWSDTLVPALDVLASEVDRQMIPEAGQTAGWDLSDVDALQESQSAIIGRVSDLMYPDVITVDEGRAMIGLEPLPGGLGGFTLTAYRQRANLTAQADFMDVITAGASVRSQVRTVRHRGRTTRVRTLERAAPTVASQLAAYDRHERIGRKALDRLAARQAKAVLRELNKTRAMAPAQTWEGYTGHTMPIPRATPDAHAPTMTHDTGQRMAADDLFSVNYWRAETVAALEGFMAGTWAEAGERAARQFGLDWDVLDPQVAEAMTARLGVLAGQVTDTTRAILDAQILQHGVEEGESVDDLADRLRVVFTDLAGWRAKLIARTETVGGFNASAHTVAAASGLVVSRQWLATTDARTRPSHARLDGHRIAGTDGTYPNGCAYPGDPNGPADETVNCRCVELFDTEDRAALAPLAPDQLAHATRVRP